MESLWWWMVSYHCRGFEHHEENHVTTAIVRLCEFKSAITAMNLLSNTWTWHVAGHHYHKLSPGDSAQMLVPPAKWLVTKTNIVNHFPNTYSQLRLFQFQLQMASKIPGINHLLEVAPSNPTSLQNASMYIQHCRIHIGRETSPNTVDGQINQSNPKCVSCKFPRPPWNSVLLFYVSRSVVRGLIYFVHSQPCFEGTNDIEIWRGWGLWMYARAWIIRPPTEGAHIGAFIP